MLLGLAGTSLLAGRANATEMEGKFHLDHPVRWAESVLEPGDYTIEVQSRARPAVVTVSSADGKRAMFIAGSFSDLQRKDASISLLQVGNDWEVRELNMPDSGITLRFPTSKLKERVKPNGTAAVTVAQDAK